MTITARAASDDPTDSPPLTAIDTSKPSRYSVAITVEVALLLPGGDRSSGSSAGGSKVTERFRSEYNSEGTVNTEAFLAQISSFNVHRQKELHDGKERIGMVDTVTLESLDSRTTAQVCYGPIGSPCRTRKPMERSDLGGEWSKPQAPRSWKDAELQEGCVRREPVLQRRLFDSRSSTFSVLTTIGWGSTTGGTGTGTGAGGDSDSDPASSIGEASRIGSTNKRFCSIEDTDLTGDGETASSGLMFTEVIADHYDIDLHSFAYEVVPLSRRSQPAQSGHRYGDKGRNTGSVLDLPGFAWTSTDCGVHRYYDDMATEQQPLLTSLTPPWLEQWYEKAASYIGGNVGADTVQERQIMKLLEQDHLRSRHLPVISAQRCHRTLTFELPPLPPDSGIILTYTANKRFVRREFQPIGASRGVQVPPSFLSYPTGGSSGINAHMVHTASFLVTAPIPDASMPFNVITLVSSLCVNFFAFCGWVF